MGTNYPNPRTTALFNALKRITYLNVCLLRQRN
nr:MAG TPA: hypothetical protein [Caudoviricetes sp.]